MSDKEKQTTPQPINALTNDPANMAPKLANKVAVEKSDADNYTLTFLYGNKDDESSILITRVALDKNIVKSLTEILVKSQEDKNEQ